MVKVIVDNEKWSESLPLIARYADVKNDVLTKI